MKVLRAYPVEQMPGETDPCRCGVNMPIGSDPCGIIGNTQGGFEILAMAPGGSGPRVWHSLYMAVADQPFEPLLGRRFGPPIGLLLGGGPPIAVLPDMPWPERVQPEVAANG
jgi:hypothetical protein